MTLDACFFGYHWDCYHHVFIDWVFWVPAVCLHLPLLFCGCRILCGWEPGSHWKWRSSSRRNASLCSATTIPVQVHAGCVLFMAGLQGSWSALLRTMLNFRFGKEAGKHWKCLLFCSLPGRIRVRNFVWIPFVRPGAEWQCPLATGKDEFFSRESQWNREESSG